MERERRTGRKGGGEGEVDLLPRKIDDQCSSC